MNKLAALTASLWMMGTSAYASEATFNEAVNLYLKGYADCREANTLRSDDIQAARQFFDNYLKILDQAAAIDPSILKTTERDMDANLTYCERVNNNLKMAEAAPVLEAGFAHCEKAKASMAANDFSGAQQAFDAYAVQRDQALAITASIMDVFSLASQVRACARLEEKLVEAREASANEAAALTQLQQQLTSYSQKCQTALSFTRQNTFTVDTIDQANRLLADAQQYRKQALKNTTANTLLKREPQPAETASLRQLEAAAGRCESEVISQIRSMSKQRSLSEQTLDAAIANLQQAKRECNNGVKLLSQSAANADGRNIDQQVRKLIQQGNTPAIASLAKRHPTWPQSKNWQQLRAQTGKCQQNLTAALAQANAVTKAPQTPTKMTAPQEADPATTDEPTFAVPAPETTSDSVAETQELSPSKLQSEAPTAAGPESPGARRNTGDWTELADEPVEAEEPDTQGKKPIRKSWTDLVQ